MANYAVDFRLELIPPQGDDVGKDISYGFRFGKCDDFKEALRLVKEVTWAERDYRPGDDHFWSVKASPANFSLLCAAFDNFQSLYDTAKDQRRLPGM